MDCSVKSFSPPYKCTVVDASIERMVEKRVDGSPEPVPIVQLDSVEVALVLVLYLLGVLYHMNLQTICEC